MKHVRHFILASTMALLGLGTGFAQTKTVVTTDNPVITNGIKNQGTYSAGTTYGVNDLVLYSGSNYLSTVASNIGNTPSSSPSQWQALNSSDLQKSANLSDVASPSLARANIGAAAAIPTLAGATADYNFRQGSGSVLTDNSGNNNNCTLGSGSAAPTWTATGLSFSPTQGVSCPAVLNGTQTFLMGVYINPVTVMGYMPNTYPSLVTSSLGGVGLNLLYGYSNDTSTFVPLTFGFTLYNNAHVTEVPNVYSAFHVLGLIAGTGGANKDRYFIDGAEVASYTLQGASAGAQSSGNLWLGSSGVSPWTTSGLQGTYYRFVTYSTQLTATQMALYSASIKYEVASRGIAVSPQPIGLAAPQLLAIGDSITYGAGLGTPATQSWPANLTLTNNPGYIITNGGVSGIPLLAITGSEPNRYAPFCQTTYGPSNAVVFAGTNDFGSVSSSTASSVMASLAGEIQILKTAGCKVFAGTMISRGGTDLLSNTFDLDKNNLDALILQQAKADGADGIIDFAANPLLGADGANANATYFQGDHTHPTAAGQLLLATAASNLLNYYFGYTIANPKVVTATTYTLASGDRAVTAAPTAAAAYTMPDCTGPSGELYTISNPQSAFTLSIVGQTSQPINGLSTAITIPSNSTVTLRDVANPKTVSGCHWAM